MSAPTMTIGERQAFVNGIAEGRKRQALEWGQTVQILLRCMDHAPKSESSREQAERMANALLSGGVT